MPPFAQAGYLVVLIPKQPWRFQRCLTCPHHTLASLIQCGLRSPIRGQILTVSQPRRFANTSDKTAQPSEEKTLSPVLLNEGVMPQWGSLCSKVKHFNICLKSIQIFLDHTSIPSWCQANLYCLEYYNIEWRKW